MASSMPLKMQVYVAKLGGKVVGETITGMNRIAEVVKESAEIVQVLGKEQRSNRRNNSSD